MDRINSTYIPPSQATRRFFHVLDVAKRLHLSEEDRDSLILYLEQEMSVTKVSDTPVALRNKMACISQKIAENEQLELAYIELRAKWQENASKMANPMTQFEALMGYNPLENAPSFSMEEQQRSHLRVVKPLQTTVKVHRLSFFRYAVAACLTLIASYGTLFLASKQFTPAHFEWASIEGYEAETDQQVVRAHETDDNEKRYFDALHELKNAQRSYLGLFPYYDYNALIRVKEKLQQVILQETTQRLATQNEASLREVDAQFFLAKTLLALGDVDQARTLLQHVASAGSLKSEDAKQLLGKL